MYYNAIHGTLRMYHGTFFLMDKFIERNTIVTTADPFVEAILFKLIVL